MPVKRRVPKDRQLVITPEIIRLFLLAEEMLEDGSADGDRSDEYRATAVELHRLPGRKPWEWEVLDVGDEAEPAPLTWVVSDECRFAGYCDAWELRRRIWDAVEASEGPEAV
jgi:hypothetical protein